MTNRKAKKGEINGDLFDRFTLAHFGVGVGLGGLTPMPLWGVALVAVGWEVIENPLKDAAPDAFPNPTHDSLGNSVVDAGAMMAGAVLARLARFGVKGVGGLFGALRGSGSSGSSPTLPVQNPDFIPGTTTPITPPPVAEQLPSFRYGEPPSSRLIYSFGEEVYPQGEFWPHTASELIAWMFGGDPGQKVVFIDAGTFTQSENPQIISAIKTSAELEGYPFEYRRAGYQSVIERLPTHGRTENERIRLNHYFRELMIDRFGEPNQPNDWYRQVADVGPPIP